MTAVVSLIVSHFATVPVTRVHGLCQVAGLRQPVWDCRGLAHGQIGDLDRG